MAMMRSSSRDATTSRPLAPSSSASGAASRVMPSPSAHAIGGAQLVAWGAAFYAIPPLLPAIHAEHGLSLATLSTAMSVSLLLTAFASSIVSRWIHHRGARAPMMTGTLLASLALLFLAASPNGATAVAAIALLGVAHAALLYEPAFAAVSSQSHDPITRTRAIQVITFWGGWAALWALPTASRASTLVGWRWTLAGMAVLLVLFTIRVHASLPRAHGSRRAASGARGTPPPISRPLALAFGLGTFATAAIVVNGFLFLGGRAVSVATASLVFALLSPAQVFSRMWFMRRGGRLSRLDGALPFVCIGIGIVALLAAPRGPAFAIFIALFGMGVGLLTTVRAAIVVARVAPEYAAIQLGRYGFVASLARAFAPALSSWFYLHVGFEVALVTFAMMALGAAHLVWRATSCVRPRGTCRSWLDDECAPSGAVC